MKKGSIKDSVVRKPCQNEKYIQVSIMTQIHPVEVVIVVTLVDPIKSPLKRPLRNKYVEMIQIENRMKEREQNMLIYDKD